MTRDTMTEKASGLDRLFDAALQFTTTSPEKAVVPPKDREGDHLGSGNGTLRGPVLRGTMRWTLYSGNCLYPRIREGQPVPDDLHICTLNPGGVITTDDGARIRFDGKGYGLRTSDQYRVSLTLVFGTEDARYAWLTHLPGVMEGEFDERAGRGIWRVYTPSAS